MKNCLILFIIKIYIHINKIYMSQKTSTNKTTSNLQYEFFHCVIGFDNRHHQVYIMK